MSDPLNSEVYEEASLQAEKQTTREHAVDEAVQRLLSAQVSGLDKRDLMILVSELSLLRAINRADERVFAYIAGKRPS